MADGRATSVSDLGFSNPRPNMHTISLVIEVIAPGHFQVVDGLVFTSCAFIKIRIDGLDLLSASDFEGSVLVMAELEQSVHGNGQYLIFTCACGIADDAGWAEIDVKHRNGRVCWSFEREGRYAYEFDAKQYATEVSNCHSHIQDLPRHITLEPRTVVFPS